MSSKLVGKWFLGFLTVAGEIRCKEVAVQKNILTVALAINRFPWMPVVCMEDTDLSANTLPSK